MGKKVKKKAQNVCRHLHLDKGIDLPKISLKIKSSELVGCEFCREEAIDRHAEKGKGENSEKKGGKSKSDSIAIWVCLECGHFSCGGGRGARFRTPPQNHAVHHFRKYGHPLAVKFGYPYLCWCFPCKSPIPNFNGKPKDPLSDIIKMIKFRLGKSASVNVRDVCFGTESTVISVLKPKSESSYDYSESGGSDICTGETSTEPQTDTSVEDESQVDEFSNDTQVSICDEVTSENSGEENVESEATIDYSYLWTDLNMEENTKDLLSAYARVDAAPFVKISRGPHPIIREAQLTMLAKALEEMLNHDFETLHSNEIERLDHLFRSLSTFDIDVGYIREHLAAFDTVSPVRDKLKQLTQEYDNVEAKFQSNRSRIAVLTAQIAELAAEKYDLEIDQISLGEEKVTILWERIKAVDKIKEHLVGRDATACLRSVRDFFLTPRV